MRASSCLLSVLLIAAAGCGGGEPATRPEVMAVGWISREELGPPLYPAFRAVADTVTVAPGFVDLLRQTREGVDVLVLLGTWCGDSKRQVPLFLKIADSAGFAPGQIRLYGVDRGKKSPEGVEAPYALERVPTFIFFRKSREIGRIVETPVTTMEADMLQILAAPDVP